MVKDSKKTKTKLPFTKDKEPIEKIAYDTAKGSIYKYIAYQGHYNSRANMTDAITLEINNGKSLEGKSNVIVRQNAHPIYVDEHQADAIIVSLEEKCKELLKKSIFHSSRYRLNETEIDLKKAEKYEEQYMYYSQLLGNLVQKFK